MSAREARQNFQCLKINTCVVAAEMTEEARPAIQGAEDTGAVGVGEGAVDLPGVGEEAGEILEAEGSVAEVGEEGEEENIGEGEGVDHHPLGTNLTYKRYRKIAVLLLMVGYYEFSHAEKN